MSTVFIDALTSGWVTGVQSALVVIVAVHGGARLHNTLLVDAFLYATAHIAVVTVHVFFALT